MHGSRRLSLLALLTSDCGRIEPENRHTRDRANAPGEHSLKDKRQVVKSLLDVIRKKFNVSAVLTLDHLDSHRRAGLAFVCVSNDKSIREQDAGQDSGPYRV